MEAKRQLIHLSGLLFVLLAQFTDRLTAAFYFFLIAITFLLYSEHVRKDKRKLVGMLESMEKRIRGFVTSFERQEAPRPFLGAFWFYFGCGAAFLLYSHTIASAACSMLVVGDALSTLIGSRFGRHKLVGMKSYEGSVAFFIGSVLISIAFVNAWLALLGSLAAMISELLPETGFLSNARKKGIIDDNLLIPVIAGFVMVLGMALI